MKLIRSLLEGRQVVTIDHAAPVTEAARVMTRHRIGALAVTDGERLVGIFTERDLMSRVVAQAKDPGRTAVGDVMSSHLVVATPDETHDVCLRRMQQNRVRHLVVLGEGRLAGVLSIRDLLAVEMDEKDDVIELLNAYVHYIPADLARGKSTT